MSTFLLPAARKQIVNALREAQVSWTDTMLREVFEEPSAIANLELFVDAQVEAIAQWLAAHPNGAVLLETFALSLLDEAARSSRAK